MTVESVKKDKKHLSRIVFEDGGEVMLDNDVVSLHCIRAGDTISMEKLEELIYESDYSRAKSRALWYLERMAHTEKALYEKLIRAGFKEKPSAAVIRRLCELGLLDDRRFAENFASRCAESNISGRETVYKMINRGVPRDLAYEVMGELEVDEQEQIKNLLERKYKNKLTKDGGADKVYAALCRKGFSFSAVRSVMKKYIEELEYYV